MVTINEDGYYDEFQYPVKARKYILFVFEDSYENEEGGTLIDFVLEASDDFRQADAEEQLRYGEILSGVAHEYLGYNPLSKLFGQGF